MKDLEKTQAEVNQPEDENLNKTDAGEDALESDFGLDDTLTDEPVLEKDYFTFNIQDIIKAVNEHEAAEAKDEAASELESDLQQESVSEPAQLELETAIETQMPEPESEPESQPEPESDLQAQATSEQDADQNHQPDPEKETLSGQEEEFEFTPEEPEVDEPEPESEPEPQPELESDLQPDDEEPEADLQPAPELVDEPQPEYELEPTSEPQPEPDAEPAPEPVPASAPEPRKIPAMIARLRGQDADTKKLVIVDIILAAVIIASIVGGLFAANALVDKANAAKQEKIAAVQENIKEVDLTEDLRAYAADEVLEQIKVPTYTLDELYALDLREKTGFTEEDLKIITTRGLKGCEKAFVEAEEKYGVNSIFLVSIASLESAYGTQMFRPNNMFGYGRTGFSSKSECIMTVAKGLGTRYLQPGASLYGGSPTLKGVNKRYAANPQWYYKVGKYMQRYYNELAAAKNGNVEKFE